MIRHVLLAGVATAGLDAVGISDREVRPTIAWEARTAQPAEASWTCSGVECPTRTVRSTPRGALGDFRRAFFRTTSPTIGIAGFAADAPLFTVELPRPLR